MILTEEQRAALKRVVAYMDEMYSVASPYHGCTEDANILRAMIDSSDHIVEPDELIGFDLERARGLRDFLQDDCAEVGDVWGEMIAEIERLREKVGKMEFLMKSPDDICLACAVKLETIAEQAARIKELEANCIYDPETGKVFVPDGHPELEKLRARNRDLVAALVEAHASRVYYEDSCPFRLWNDIKLKDKFLQEARQQLQVGGMIGNHAAETDQMVPNGEVWQITEERRGAIDRAMRVLGWAEHAGKTQDVHVATDVSVLRAMLKEAE